MTVRSKTCRIGCSDAAFSLSLALFRWERELVPPVIGDAAEHSFSLREKVAVGRMRVRT